MRQDPGKRSSDPTRDWPRCVRECPEVSGGGVGWWWPAAGLGPVHAGGTFWRRWDSKHNYLHYLHHSLASGQTTGREHRPTHQQKIGLKIYGPAHQNKTQFPPEAVSHIRKLPEASYYSPSEGRQNENHNHRKLTNLITWTTALSNAMKLWPMPCRATQVGQVMVESSDKTPSTGEGNGKPLQHSCLENPMKGMTRQKDRTLKDELCRLVGVQYATGDQWENNSERMKRQSQSKNNTQLWMWLMMEVKTDAVKNNIAK